MRNYYNNSRPQLSNMSFPFISKYMFLQIKVCRAYSRNLGQRSILARKGIYEKCTFFKKVPQKFSPPPLLNPFCNFCKRVSVGLNMPWNVYYYFHFICIVRSTFFEGVRSMLELNILQQSDKSSPVAY